MTAEIFQIYHGVKPAAARLLAALHAADGDELTFDAMQAATGQTVNGVRHSLQQLRAAMDEGAIQNNFGTSYQLTAVGMAECARALADAAQTQGAQS